MKLARFLINGGVELVLCQDEHFHPGIQALFWQRDENRRFMNEFMTHMPRIARRIRNALFELFDLITTIRKDIINYFDSHQALFPAEFFYRWVAAYCRKHSSDPFIALANSIIDHIPLLERVLFRNAIPGAHIIFSCEQYMGSAIEFCPTLARAVNLLNSNILASDKARFENIPCRESIKPSAKKKSVYVASHNYATYPVTFFKPKELEKHFGRCQLKLTAAEEEWQKITKEARRMKTAAFLYATISYESYKAPERISCGCEGGGG